MHLLLSLDTLLGQSKSPVDWPPSVPGVSYIHSCIGPDLTEVTEQFRDRGWETRDATTKRLLARHKVIVSVRGPLQQSQLRDQVDGNTLMVLDAVRPCVEGPGGRSAEVGTLGPTPAIEK